MPIDIELATKEFTKQGDELVRWIIEDALPLWSTKAKSPYGGYVEALDHEGQPQVSSIRRARVQSRQAYVFAHAAWLNFLPNLEEHSNTGFDALLRVSRSSPESETGFAGYAHVLDAHGDIIDGRFDTYDHAFVLLACAWRIKAFGDTRAVAVAKATDEYLEQELLHPIAGYHESIPHKNPRRQNPHMHLFEAYIALYTATADPKYAQRAEYLLYIFIHYFFDRKNFIVREFFDESLNADNYIGTLFEPGHSMEWVWLLSQYDKIFGSDHSEISTALYNQAILVGQHDDSSFLIDYCDIFDPKKNVKTRRTWVQTEYLKATISLARFHDPKFYSQASKLIKKIMDTYLSPPISGGWYDKYGADHSVISEVMPTSTFYHIFSAAAETCDAIQELAH